MSSNYPPGMNGSGFRPQQEIAMECRNGHKWVAEGWYELGAYFISDEEYGMYCPDCGAIEKDEGEELMRSGDTTYLFLGGPELLAQRQKYTLVDGVWKAKTLVEYERQMEELDRQMGEEL